MAGTTSASFTTKALEIGPRLGALNWMADVQLTLARLLFADRGANVRDEIEAWLDAADSAIAETATNGFTPRVLEVRGDLATVLGDVEGAGSYRAKSIAGYDAIGANGHSDRLRAIGR